MHEMQNVTKNRQIKCVKVSGRVMVECKDTIVCLQAFGSVLSAIAGNNVTEEALLEAPPFNENHIIVAMAPALNGLELSLIFIISSSLFSI